MTTRALPLVVLTLIGTLGPGLARGETGRATPVAPALPGRLAAPIDFRRPPPVRVISTSQNQPVEPVHTVPTGVPANAAEPLSVTQKWWFWAGVGALLVSTAVLLVVATRQSEAPRTQLKDMEAFR